LKRKKKKYSMPIEIASISGDGNHLFAEVFLNHHPVRVVIDTGASRSVFDKEVIQKMLPHVELKNNEESAVGMGSNQIESSLAILPQLKIGKLNLYNYPAGILDMQHANGAYEKLSMKPVHGILGCDVLVKYKASLSLRNKRITFRV
jgi:predicted aspartyl protease